MLARFPALRLPGFVFSSGYLLALGVISFMLPLGTAVRNETVVIWLAIAGACLSVAAFLAFHSRLAVLLVFSIFLAFFRYADLLPSEDESHVRALFSATGALTLTGEISREPEHFDLDSRYRVAVHEAELLGAFIQIEGTVLVTVPRYPAFRYGDGVTLRGTLELPPHDAFISYRTYLWKEGIAALMYRPVMALAKGAVAGIGTAERGGSPFWHGVIRLKELFAETVFRRFPEPYGSYLLGLLIGVRRSIPPDIIEAFRITGLTHVLALSGFNITIIAAAIAFMLRRFSPRTRISLACLGITAFVLFVGASTSVVRAGIMGCLGLIALGAGRPQAAWYPLIIAGTAMAVWNPFVLVYDVGFQLSFAATAGLIFFSRPITSWLKKFSIINKLPSFLTETFAVTLAAQIATFPLITIHFQQFSIISFISNLIVLPFITITMLFGFIAVVLDLLVFGLGIIPGAIAYACLWFMLNSILLMSKIPWASVSF